MSHIFISYSRKDLDFAKRIVQALKENSLDVWIDWMSIWKGEEWKPAIQRGIEEADAFLFLISPDSVISEPCNEEITHALENNKLIIPIVIRDAKKEAIREELSKLNWIFCRYELGNPEVTIHEDDFTIAIEEVRKAIHTDYEWLKYQARLQVKALDWERYNDNSKLLRGKDLQEAEQKLASVDSRKAPQPTNLQRQFVGISRKVENEEQRKLAEERKQTRKRLRNRGFILSGVAVLAIWFASQVVPAQIREQQANETAQAESTARAEAQIQVTEQKNIADTRQLATIANNLSLEQGETAILSGLLAIEAARRYPELDSDQALRRFLNVVALPISEIKFDKSITSLNFSSDGEKVAAASSDGTVRVWNAMTGNEIIRLKTESNFVKFSLNGKWLITIDCINHEEGLHITHCTKTVGHVWNTDSWEDVTTIIQGNYVNTVEFSSNSNLIVSGGEDRSVIILEAATGKILFSMLHTDKESYGVSSVDFSPDGKLVVSGGTSDHTAIVWDVATGNKIAQMAHDGEVQFTRFSPNNKWIISGGYSHEVKVWDAYSGKEISRLALDSFAYKGFFSPDGKLAAVEGKDFIIIMNPQTGQIISRLLSGGLSFSLVSFSLDSKQLFTGGNLAKVWDVVTGTELTRIVFDGGAWAFSSDGKKVAFGNKDGTVYIRKFPTNQEVSLMTHEGSVESIDFSPDSKMIVSGSQDGTTRVWDTLTGQEISRIVVDGLVVSVNFRQDGRLVAQAACEGVSEGYVNCGKAVVRIWEAETGRELYQLKPDFGVTTIKLVPNSTRIVIAGSNASLQLWDFKSGKILSDFNIDLSGGEFSGQAGTWVNNVDVDSSGHLIVAHGQVWDLKTNQEIFRLVREAGGSLDVFSPSGNWIASVDGLNIRIWSPKNGKELIRIPLEPLTNSVSSLAFSQDEKWLAGSGGTFINVWEVSTGLEISRITTDTVNSIAFSPNENWIASAGYDNTARVWLWRSADLISEVCKRLPRNLTQTEWKQYIGNEPYRPTCPNLSS
jgi:WD40 repeat protein